MTKLSNSMNQIFTSDELGILGLSPGDGNIVKTLNISTAERLVDSAGLDEETAANLKGKLLQVQTAQRNYNNLQAKLRSDEIQLNSVFDTWKEHRDRIEGGIGWYRVNNEEAKIILDNRLDSYDKYVDYINQNYKELYNPETYSSTWVRKDGVTTGAKYLGDILTKKSLNLLCLMQQIMFQIVIVKLLLMHLLNLQQLVISLLILQDSNKITWQLLW